MTNKISSKRTARQNVGDWAELLVCKQISCPRCKRTEKTLCQLRANFKCADIICDFCGHLLQVKSRQVTDVGALPSEIPGAAWEPQRERMKAGYFCSLVIVLRSRTKNSWAIYSFPAEHQVATDFVPRKPLGKHARRAGWQGFVMKLPKDRVSLIKRHG